MRRGDWPRRSRVDQMTDHQIRPTEFHIKTAEGDGTPYTFRVLRAHRSPGYYECVCVSGGSPARHNGIDIFHRWEIMRGKVPA
jgi:hypothetical protein